MEAQKVRHDLATKPPIILKLKIDKYKKRKKVKVTQSCPTLCDPMESPWNSPGQNTEVEDFPSTGIFPTQGSNPGLPHCKQILYQLSHKYIVSKYSVTSVITVFKL